MQEAQASGIGALISFELKDGYDKNIFVKSLELFDLAVSLGGVESLICHPASMTHESYDKALQEKIGISDGLLRLAIGIENADDLIFDLEQAIKKSQNLTKFCRYILVAAHHLLEFAVYFGNLKPNEIRNISSTTYSF